MRLFVSGAGGRVARSGSQTETRLGLFCPGRRGRCCLCGIVFGCLVPLRDPFAAVPPLSYIVELILLVDARFVFVVGGGFWMVQC